MKSLEDFKFNEPINNLSIIHNFDENCPSVVDRFFTRYFKIFPNKTEDEDHLVLFHSNRICLVQLAPSHVAFKKGIQSVRFDFGNIDRSLNFVKGKGKKGGMQLQTNSTVAIIKCKDDTEYRIQSCILGKLIEVNNRLVEHPELLEIEGTGFIATVLPKPENCDSIKESLFTEIQYNILKVPK